MLMYCPKCLTADDAIDLGNDRLQCAHCGATLKRTYGDE